MKVTINGEKFDYDGRRQKVAEALAIEEAYGRRYVEWQEDLAAGGAKALCTLAWLIWRRDGRDIPLDDILTEKVELDLHELLGSLIEAGMEELKAAGVDPTAGPPAPDRTLTTGTATSGSSRNGSASAPGKSRSSKSRTSKR